MKDLLELWCKTFGRKTRPRVKRFKNEGININPIPKRNPLPNIAPPGPPTVREVNLLKKKDRLNELEKEVAVLREQFALQAELLEKYARQLGELTRDVSHLLPEK